MIVERTGIIASRLTLTLALLAAGTIARADVKAGTDAWGRGDYAAAVQQWQGPAEAGDPDAEFNLAQAYRLGRGVPRDLARAESLFGKAAAQGHVQAADNYGLLMFDRGDRASAMPYVRAAADRGDPRAQYLMGIAHFNGDLAPKDWTRAYAYITLAQSAGLPQAAPARAQMDQHIPMAQRQAAASLATQLGEEAKARRASQLAAADLGNAPGGVAAVRPAIASPAPAPSLAPAPSTVPLAASAPPPSVAIAAATRTAGNDTPATAGADYARPVAAAAVPKPVAPPATKPVVAAVAPPAPKPPVKGPAVLTPAPKPTIAATAPAPAPAHPASGGWRVQLGAFGVAANADALWVRAKARPELAGHQRIDVPAGKVRKLQAGGFATRDAAARACTGLSSAGFVCLPAQD